MRLVIAIQDKHIFNAIMTGLTRVRDWGSWDGVFTVDGINIVDELEVAVEEHGRELGARLRRPLTHNSIELALAVMSERSILCFHNIMSGRQDQWDGDVLIQYAVFGEVIYC